MIHELIKQHDDRLQELRQNEKQLRNLLPSESTIAYWDSLIQVQQIVMQELQEIKAIKELELLLVDQEKKISAVNSILRG